MYIHDLDWAQEVDAALRERQEQIYMDDLIEAHAMLRIWFSGRLDQQVLA